MSESRLSDPSVFLSSFLSAIVPDFTARLTFKSASDLTKTFAATRENGPRSINAIRKFGREVAGDVIMSLDTDAGTLGFVMIFDAGADTAATVLAPSLTLEAEDGRRALAYLGKGDVADMEALRADLEPQKGDRYTLGTDMPMPFGSWALSEDDEEKLERGEAFAVYDFPAMEKVFFPAKVEPESSSEVATESEDQLRARLIDALTNADPNPAQAYALKLAGRGFYPIPVHGVVKKKKSKELECACQAGKRNRAEKNRAPVEICGSPGKHPAIEKWETHNASRDPDVLMHTFNPKFHRQRSGVNEGLNIGIVTGPDTGVVVLDIDGPGGAANLAKLEEAHGALPNTVAVVTGSGGRHYYFRAPAGITILNSASKIAPKIDFRGEHGFVVAPPSKHIKGGSYRWETARSIDDLQPVDMPEWLVRLAVDGGEKEAADKPRKATRKASAKAAGSTASKSPTRFSSDVKGWRGYLELVGDHEGGSGFDGPIWDAMLSYLRQHGHDADESEFMEALGATVESADKSAKDNRDRYQPDSDYIAGPNGKLEKARQVIRDTPDKEYAIDVDDDGWITIGDDNTRFCIARHEGRDWIHTVEWTKDDKGNLVRSVGAPCNTLFKVLRVAKDTAGGGAAITIGYETRHDGPRELTFPMALLYERADLLKLLRSNFFPMSNENGVIAFFKELDLPINTLIVVEPGWKDGGYLHFDGTYVPALDSSDASRLSYMLGNLPENVVGQGGTMEGWKEGIARIFDPNREHLEPFQFGLFTGGSGYIASLINTQEVPEMNFGGETRSSKTTSFKFGASVSSSPVRGHGVLRKCHGTDNAMEMEAVRYGGGTNYFDEAMLMLPKYFGPFRWRVAEGSTKARLDPNSKPKPIYRITGMSFTSVECGAIAHAEKHEKQPDGLRSRLVEISYDGIPKLTGEAKEWIFGKVEKQGEDQRVLAPGAVQMIEANFGWGWRPIVEHLQSIGRDRAAGEVEHYANLIDPKAEGVQRAQAKIMALVWYSGALMKRLGLLPDHVTDADIEAVIRWAWARRSEDSLLSPFNKAMVALGENSTLMRGNEIVDVDAFEERYFGNRLAYLWKVTDADVKGRNPEVGFEAEQEWLCVPTKDGCLAKLCEATGKTGKGIVKQMRELGLLALEGKKRQRPDFSKLPNKESLPHIRINLAKLDDYLAGLRANRDESAD